MTWRSKAENIRAAALAAVIPVLFLCGVLAQGQRQNGQPAGAPRMASGQSQAARPQPTRPQSARPEPVRPQAQMRSEPRSAGQTQARPRGQYQTRQPQYDGRPQSNVPPRQYGYGTPTPNYWAPAPGYSGGGGRPVYQGTGAGGGRPTYPAQVGPQMRETPNNAGMRQNLVPAGHLEDWLNQHRNVPVQNQEQMLRSDPSFGRLPKADQQRLTQQLRQLNQMPLQQRERRLERAEVIEHMSPQERTQLSASTQRLGVLSTDRQMLVKRAFQDLRAVPVDQRPTVLNSARYQGAFSADERGILSDLLRAEPYEAPK